MFFGVSGLVSIDTIINVEKRKLTKQTIEKFEKEFIPRIFNRCEDVLDDDTDRTLEKEHTL